MATSITVELHRGSIDPEGLGSDEDLESIREFVLDAVREAFPGATVRAVLSGGETSGVTDDGVDITYDVRHVVNRAFNDWCAQ
jgi:hypothetical protein